MYKIEIEDNKCIISSSWNEDFSDFIKYLNGRWDSKNKVWNAPISALSVISKKLYELHGTGEGVTVEVTIDKYNVKKNLYILGRDIIVINQFNNEYNIDFYVILTKGNLPEHWQKKKSSYDNDYRCYFMKRLELFLNPFIIRDVTFTIIDIVVSEVENLKRENKKWIKSLKIVSDLK